MKTKRSKGNQAVAVAYLRVSTDEQDNGVQAQRAAIQRWTEGRGVNIVAWHEDRVSGATGVEARPGMLDALESLQRIGAGILVAAKRDRIARDVVVAATVERLVAGAGAVVVTADGVTVEDSPEGALMRTLVDAFASYERSLIKSRTRAALAVKRSRGERVSRFAPVGFRFEDGRLVVDESEAAMVERIRAMRGRGLSVRRIVDVLTAEGSTLRGGRWHERTIRRTLERCA
jgi:DNA invertase Pin-like site-specific DNA recombinase